MDATVNELSKDERFVLNQYRIGKSRLKYCTIVTKIVNGALNSAKVEVSLDTRTGNGMEDMLEGHPTAGSEPEPEKLKD